MKFYQGRVALSLRGACLTDGIFVNFSKLCNISEELNNQADFVTLILHETGHFLSRQFSNNYNFSSPYAQCGLRNMPTKEAEIPSLQGVAIATKNLEFGRMIELMLVQTQPNWERSTPQVASQFLEQLRNPNASLPFNITGIESRSPPSLSFGIDLADEYILFE